MKKVITLALFLAVVAGLSGAALSFVHDLTEPIIEEATLETVKESLVKIYSHGETFQSVTTSFDEYPALEECYEASLNGQIQGYVYKATSQGYGGPVSILIGLDSQGTYIGFEVIDCSSETKGIGDRILDESFKNTIIGTEIGQSIDTISGATYSSTAVVENIQQATLHYQENFQ